jgi:hypothetical protein
VVVIADYQQLARQYAQKYGLNPNVFVRQIRQESGFNPNARSKAGAVGIAQIMPATARGWGVDPTNPRAALDAAAKNMAGYVKRYGSYRNALVAYNAGPGNVGKPLPAETQGYIRTILGGSEPSPSSARSSSSSSPSTSSAPVTTTIDRSADRQQALLSYLDQRHDPNALLSLGTQLKSLQDITTTTPGSPSTSDSGMQSSGGGGQLDQIINEANQIDKAHLPYQWGGGHNAQNKRGAKLVPLDCSGAVSRALGVNARVSGQFAKWGAPGPGEKVTIYANNTHVLMKIGNRFWGTSSTNPRGGAGWIPASAISKDYLKRFTARHPPGL